MARSRAQDRLPRAFACIEHGRAAGWHVGFQLYVSCRGEVLADAAFGAARPGVPMTPDTLMLWFSSGKPLAAVAIAQLWERGRLDLDDPVCRHVPEFAEHGKAAVTLRHLLTHTGGFLRAWHWAEYATLAWGETIARICAAELEPGWVPGQRAGYHPASGWFMLGEVVRRVDGRPYSRYVREAICEPLGMADTWVGMPVDRYRAYGHRIGLITTRAGVRRAHTPSLPSTRSRRVPAATPASAPAARPMTSAASTRCCWVVARRPAPVC